MFHEVTSLTLNCFLILRQIIHHQRRNLDCKTVRIFAYSSTRGGRGARALRARKTITPRFTDFFTDFKKKTQKKERKKPRASDIIKPGGAVHVV